MIKIIIKPFARWASCAIVGPRENKGFFNRFLYVDLEYLGCSIEFWRN